MPAGYALIGGTNADLVAVEIGPFWGPGSASTSEGPRRFTAWDAKVGGTQYLDTLDGVTEAQTNGIITQKRDGKLPAAHIADPNGTLLGVWIDDGDDEREWVAVQGKRGPIGPSGGPVPDMTGVPAGRMVRSLGNNGAEWVDPNAALATKTRRTINGDANNLVALGTGEPVTNQTNDVYIVTIAPHPTTGNVVETSGAGAGAVGFNIGQWILRATDGALGLHRGREVCNIEHDFIQLEQSGGTASFEKVVSSRFRFAIPKAGVTIVDNKGIDFTVPNASDVTGAVTNYIAMNIPALAGGGGTNHYGIRFNNEPDGGSIVSRFGDLVLKALSADTSVRIEGGPGASGAVKLVPGSGASVIAGGPTGALGSMELAPVVNVGGVRSRLIYGTDGTGWKFGIAKNVGGVVTDLMTILDQGDVAITRGLGVHGVTPPAARPTVSGSRGGNAALASLLTAIAATGLISDGTTA